MATKRTANADPNPGDPPRALTPGQQAQAYTRQQQAMRVPAALQFICVSFKCPTHKVIMKACSYRRAQPLNTCCQGNKRMAVLARHATLRHAHIIICKQQLATTFPTEQASGCSYRKQSHMHRCTAATSLITYWAKAANMSTADGQVSRQTLYDGMSRGQRKGT